MSALKLSFIISAVDRATAQVRAVNNAIGRITAPVRRVQASLRSLGVEAGLPKVGEAASQVSRRFGELTGVVRSLTRGFFWLTAGATAASYPLLRFIDEAGKINDTAAMLGMSARNLQRLSYALTLDGSSMEDAAGSLRFLQRNAVEALSGSKEMQVWFRRAGMSAAFLKKNLNDPQALLYKFADGVAAIGTPAKRLALAQAVLGRGSARTVQTLARGSAELKRLGDEAESIGAVLDDKLIAEMDETGDTMLKARRSVWAVVGSLATALLPVIRTISLSIIEWTKANRELISTRVSEFVTDIVQGLPEFWKQLKEIGLALKQIGGAISSVVQLLRGWGVVAKILAGVLALKLVLAVWGLGAAIIKLSAVALPFAIQSIIALSTALFTTPVGWFLLAIAAIAGAAYLIYKNWEPIAAFFTGLWDGILATFNKAVEWINGKCKSVMGWVSGIAGDISNLLPDFLKGGIPGITVNAPSSYMPTVQLAPPVPSSLPLAYTPASADVSGKIHIQIDSEGMPRIKELRSDNRKIDFDMDAGYVMVTP